MASPAMVRVPSPTPAYPGVYRPLISVGLKRRGEHCPLRDDGSVDELRLWIWKRVMDIWAFPLDPVAKGETAFGRRVGRPRSSRQQCVYAIAELIGLTGRGISGIDGIKAVRRAGLHRPQQPEAWWAGYSNLIKSLGEACWPNKSARGLVMLRATSESVGAHRPVQGAKGQVPSLSGEYARLFCQLAVAGDPGSPANSVKASVVTVRRKAATAIAADNPTKGGREPSSVALKRNRSSSTARGKLEGQGVFRGGSPARFKSRRSVAQAEGTKLRPQAAPSLTRRAAHA